MIRNNWLLTRLVMLAMLAVTFASCANSGNSLGQQDDTSGEETASTVTNPTVTGATRDVASWTDFSAALKDSAVSTIRLSSSIQSPQPDYDDVMVMGNVGRDLVIVGNGHELTLNYAGIVLGGNLTLKNISLDFKNLVRNCIVANGHTLTLEGIKDTGTATSIHLFCGGITGYTGSTQLPATGAHGKIVVRGTGNQLGNIYAGSLDDAPNEGAAKDNDFDRAASIIVERGASFDSLGSIYAHGAREFRGTGDGDGLAPDSSKYGCSGGVVVDLQSTLPSKSGIDGKTGSSTNATLKYTDYKGNYYAPTLEGIGRLELKKGSHKPNFAPATGSSFAPGASISLPADTRLDLTSLGEDGSFDFSSLAGGGLLVLKTRQSVTISGGVSGETRLAIGGVNYDETNSTGAVAKGHNYIVAARSTASSFVLLPPTSDETLGLQRSAGGEWSVPSDPVATATKVTGFSLNSPGTVGAGASGVSIPVTVSYSSGEYLSDIPAVITVNGNPAVSSYDESLGYSYTVTVNGLTLEIYFTTSDGLDEALSIYSSNGAALSGAYNLEVTIPSGNTTGGQELKSTVDFTVN